MTIVLLILLLGGMPQGVDTTSAARTELARSGFSRFTAPLEEPNVDATKVAASQLGFASGFEDAVELHGKAAFLSALSFSEVELTTNRGVRRTAQANEAGEFVLSFEHGRARSDVYVSLRATGVGTQQYEEYAAILGSEAYLAGLASGSPVLTPAELPALHLNPYQSAVYLAMRDLSALPELDGVPQFARMRHTWRSEDFYWRGQLIALLGVGALDLPPGATSFLDALSDGPSYQNLMYQFWMGSCEMQPEFCHAIDWIMNDPEHVPLLDSPPTDTPIQFYSPFGLGNPSGHSDVRARVIFKEDGTGRFYSFVPAARAESLILWTWSNHTIRFARADGEPLRTWTSSSGPDPACPESWGWLYEVLAYHTSFSEGPDASLLASLTPELRLTRLNCPGSEPVIQAFRGASYRYPVLLGDKGVQPFPDPSGRAVILPRCGFAECPNQPADMPYTGSADKHVFAPDGTGTTDRTAERFSWQRVGTDVLSVTYANGDTSHLVAAGAEGAYFTTVGLYSHGATDEAISSHAMFAVPRPITSEWLTSYHFYKRTDCELPFTEISGPCEPGIGGLQFAVDGTGLSPPNYEGLYRLEWEIDASGRLEIRRIRTTSTPEYIDRYLLWELVAEDANYAYLIERSYPAYGPRTTSFEQLGTLVAYRKMLP